MAHFGQWNTSDPAAGNAVLTNGQQIILGPIQTDRAQKIAGSVFADQPGTLYIEQSFDGGAHYDISQSVSVVAGTGQQIFVDIVAPWVQIRYVNGATTQGVFRLFTRTFATGN